MILATAFVKYRDITHIWEVVLQGLFYLTPILYPLTLVTKPLFQKILMLSPIATAIQDARYSVVTKATLTTTSVYGNALYRLLPYGITLVFLVVGVIYFKSQAKNFAEDL